MFENYRLKQQLNFSPLHIEQASEQHSHSVKGLANPEKQGVASKFTKSQLAKIK